MILQQFLKPEETVEKNDAQKAGCILDADYSALFDFLEN